MIDERIVREGLLGTAAYENASLYEYRGEEYRYFAPEHTRILSLYTQALENPEQEHEVTLFPADPDTPPQTYTLTLMNIKKLLNLMDETAANMAKARKPQKEAVDD